METQVTSANVSDDLPIEDREALERLALERICPCFYYDLADYIGETSDEELIAIVEESMHCGICGTAGEER